MKKKQQPISNKQLFTNFSYHKKDVSPANYQEYIVNFTYQGKEIYYYAFNKKGVSLDDIKKEINEKINDGSLEKYAKRYIKKVCYGGRVALRTALVSLLVVGGAGVGAYYIVKQYYPSVTPEVEHTIYFNCTDCHAENGSGAKVESQKWLEGSLAKYSIIPDGEGYQFPADENFHVYYHGTQKEFSEYTYDSNTGKFSIKMNADYDVKAASIKPGPVATHTVSFAGKNCVFEGGMEELSVEENTPYNFQITPDANFSYPEAYQLDVTHTGSAEKFTDYTYIKEKGVVSFLNITDNITITATSSPDIPVPAGSVSFFFKMSEESVEMNNNKESVYLGGPVTGQAVGLNAPEFARFVDTDYYYTIVSSDSITENEYYLMKGFASNYSKIPEAERGLQIDYVGYGSEEWLNLNISDNLTFEYDGKNNKIDLDEQTFFTNVVDVGDTSPISNYTFSVEFEEAIPEDCNVLIFGGYNGWLTPTTGEPSIDKARIKSATMSPVDGSENKVFTLTLDSVNPGKYEYLISVEHKASIYSIDWNKILEAHTHLKNPDNNLYLTIDKDDSGATNYLFNNKHKAHFNRPEGTYHKITFVGEDCYMQEGEDKVTEVYVKENLGIDLALKPDQYFLTPSSDQVALTYTTGGGEFSEYVYDSSTGTLSINNVPADITITAAATPNIPTEEGKTAFYFGLGRGSVTIHNYESPFITGTFADWTSGLGALKFNQFHNSRYYYSQVSTSAIQGATDYYYQLVLGFNENSTVTSDKQGLQWGHDGYKSEECLAYENNPSFNYTGSSTINLGTQTFLNNVVEPNDSVTLNNYTFSVEFDKAVPGEDKVLFFYKNQYDYDWWSHVPTSDKSLDQNKEIIKNAEMTLVEGSNNKIFTYTVDAISQQGYNYFVLVENKDATYMVQFNKITNVKAHANEVLYFTIDGNDGSGFTKELFTTNYPARFDNPVGERTVTGLGVNGTVTIKGESFNTGELVTGTIAPNQGYLLPTDAAGIKFYKDSSKAEPIGDVKVIYDQSGGGDFSFVMPAAESVYVDAICPLNELYVVTTNCENEHAPSSISGRVGQTIIIYFNQATEGHHIAKTLEEFKNSHTIDADSKSYEISDYKWIEEDPDIEIKGPRAELTIKILKAGYMTITGSAPSDNP